MIGVRVRCTSRELIRPPHKHVAVKDVGVYAVIIRYIFEPFCVLVVLCVLRMHMMICMC